MNIKKLISVGLISSLLMLLPLTGFADVLTKSNSTPAVNDQLEEQFQKFQESQKSSKEYERILAPLREKAMTLNGQMANIDAQMQLSSDSLERTRTNIEKKKVDVAALMESLGTTQAELDAQKQMVSDFVHLLWEEEQKYRSSGEDGDSLLRLLLADADTFSDAMRPIKYYELLEQNSRRIFHRLEISSNSMVTEELKLEEERGRLAALEAVQEQQYIDLQTEKAGKEQIMAETQGMQSKYEALLAESLQQEEESAAIISALKGRKQEIASKLSEISPSNDPYDISRIDQEIGDKPFSWPIEPNQGLSAYFLDPNYDRVFHTKHYAVDIPTRQGSPIYAPANGYVTTVRDNGYGYSYLIVAHAGNLATLYGHVSAFVVKEGDLVHRGDIIAYSGATPGTKGAGARTTGPHLHFEVHENGVPVDPLKYLPLSADLVERMPAVIQERVQRKEY